MSQRINWSKDGTIAYLVDYVGNWKSALTVTECAMLDASSIGYNGEGKAFPTNQEPVFNFASPFKLTQIGVSTDRVESVSVEIGNSIVNGWESVGWTQILTSQTIPRVNEVFLFEIPIQNQQACLWAKVKFGDTWVRKLLLFGEYTNPRFEFWHPINNAEFTDNYPLVIPPIPNYQDSGNIVTQFRIFNADTVSHSYSGYLEAVTYGGDASITDHITLSPTTISNLAGETASSVISVTANYPMAHNPADGYHQFKVRVVEVA